METNSMESAADPPSRIINATKIKTIFLQLIINIFLTIFFLYLSHKNQEFICTKKINFKAVKSLNAMKIKKSRLQTGIDHFYSSGFNITNNKKNHIVHSAVRNTYVEKLPFSPGMLLSLFQREIYLPVIIKLF